MKRTETKPVLIALDSTTDIHKVLQAAGNLSTFFKRDLRGLFIEDIDFVHHAGLTSTQRLITPSGAFRGIDADSMNRILQTAAREIRNAIRETASSLSLEWSFDVSRGEFFKQLLSVSESSDLLVVARYSKTHLLPTATQATSRDKRDQIMLVISKHPSSERALEIGARISSSNNAEVTIVVLADNRTEYAQLEEQARKILSKYGINPRFVLSKEHTPLNELSKSIQGKTGLVVVGIQPGFNVEDELDEFSKTTACPVILVR